jgi:AraC-like DNA-binding protein
MHFHGVAELVLFERVSGEFIADGRRHRIGDGAVVFVPSMRRHDFALGPGAKSWLLVQIDALLVEALARRSDVRRLTRSFCAWPAREARGRLSMLTRWLVEAVRSGPGDPIVPRLVELLLIVAAEAPENGLTEPETSTARADRLTPVLDRMRAAPAEAITLEQAAAICSLSPAYFSRKFSSIFGMSFTEYARVHRLHLAARQLATTGRPVSQIAYDVGFSSPSYFSARFRERFAMTPREYRSSAMSRA